MGMKENTRGGGPLLAEMARIAIPISLQSLITAVSYTHLTLPTKA